MSNLLNNNNNIILPKQKRYLLIVLWLFPLLLINLGWFTLNYIDSIWQKPIRDEQSRQEVEALAASSDFTYCFASISGSFYDDLKSGIESFKQPNNSSLETFIKNRADYRFRAPFPSHELYVFQQSKDSNSANIIYSNVKNITGKRAWGIAFEYLTKVNIEDNSYTEDKKKKGISVLRSLFGEGCEPNIIAETQRGKASYISYKRKSNLFYWDYYKDNETKNLFGFIILLKNESSNDNIGKLIALRDLKESPKNEREHKFGAFLPIFPGYGGIIANEEFAKMPEYTTLTKKWIPHNIKQLYNWHLNGAPSAEEDVKFGNYQAFFHIAPGQSHCAVLLFPLTKEWQLPLWLIISNIFFTSFIFLLLIRGFLLGIWPQTTLKTRFFTTYFLAACIPLGLLIIATYGYITNYKHTALIHNKSQLRLCINQFDTRKSQSQDEYRTVFMDLIKDPKIADFFKELDRVNEEIPQTILPEAKKALTRSVEFFNKDSGNLPILSLTIIDERGACLTNLGNGICHYYKDLDKKEFTDINREYSPNEKKDKKLIEVSLDAFLYSVLQPLRNRISSKPSNKKKWTKEYEGSWLSKSAIGGFKTALGNTSDSLFEEMDKRRSVTITRMIGDKTICLIHDYILVNGTPRFIVFLQWDADALDVRSLTNTLDYFSLTKPNFEFSTFISNPQGVKPWLYSRHNTEYETSKKLANQAFLSKNAVHFQNEEKYITAIPSKKYTNTFIVGGFSLNYLKIPIFYRLWVCIIIIVLSLMIFIFCVFFSSKLFLKPISKLEVILEKVASGHLDIEIKSKSNDEIGTMCKEFNEMTSELLERNKLATLLSDHAVEALSKNEAGISKVENLVGTALVSDIRNFTVICEKYDPNTVTTLLNEHFALMTKIISSNGGRIYKYIGDAIEVIFVNEDDSKKTSVERAIKTAVEMIDCLEKINLKRKEDDLFEYKIGIGLSYGKLISGSIGSIETRLDYAILGNTLDKAIRLESLSKLNQNLPIIVDKEFVEELAKTSSEIAFLPLKKEENIESFKIDYNNYLKEKNNIINKNEILNNFESSNTSSNHSINNSPTISYEIEEEFSFTSKISLGLFFYIILAVIILGGYYFTYTTSLSNQKSLLETENQLTLGQIKCEDYGRIVFDMKCREIAKNLNNAISTLSEKDITEELIEKVINDNISKDKSIKKCDLKKIFVKVGDYSNYVKEDDTAFCDKIPLKAIANKDFSEYETQQIVDSFRICIALKELKQIAANKKLSDDKNYEFQLPFKQHLERTYGEPTRKLFGEKILISLLVENSLNSTLEGLYKDESIFFLCIDYYIFVNSKPKLIGYFLFTMPTQKAFESIPLILDVYSKDNGYIALKNRKTKDWDFSENVPEKLINNVKKTISINETINSFQSFGDIINNDLININNDTYDILLINKCDRNNKKTFLIFAFLFLLSSFIIYEFKKIIKGKSWINHSISAKLWLTLLIVAVIPVITMFFVFNLFINEYYYVIISQKRSDMQRFADEFEQKREFSTPIIWTSINKEKESTNLINNIRTINDINNSKETREKALRSIRQITENIVDKEKKYSQREKTIISTSITDISIYGKTGWSYCLTDSKDNISDKIDFEQKKEKEKEEKSFYSVSYIESNSSREAFGLFLKIIAKAIWDRHKDSSEKGKMREKIVDSAKNDIAFEMSSEAIKSFFGEDTLLKIFQGGSTPVELKLGIGKIGMLTLFVPNDEKPEAIIVWMVTFKILRYLRNLSKLINTDYNIYMAENFKYGKMGEETYNNDLRIQLAKYASCISSANFPISTSLNLSNGTYILEGTTSRARTSIVLLLSYPEKLIKKEVDDIIWVFYLILGMSLIIIIANTSNIANDIINPIQAIIAGIKEVNRENFAFRISSDRKDELGTLCHYFDKMIKGLEEKRTMSHMLSKTAQIFTLKGNGTNSENINSVMIYVGIPNFNLHTQRLSDEEIISYLKEQTSIIAGIIMKEGGEIDKIMGEKLLAVFPITKTPKEAALAAYRVARSIQAQEKSNNLPFPVAIGLNYGNVISGFLGVGNKRDFTIIGDPVNVAARIESLAENMKINRCLVSETLYSLISEQSNANLYGEVELKGKSQPMKVYKLF